MTVTQAIQTRKSIRKYDAKPVEQEKLTRVLEAGRLAPSAMNRQDWKILAVTDQDKIMKMQDACMGQKQVGMAPVTLVVCANNDVIMNCGQSKASVDCSIAMSFMMLAATEQGLGTCWLGAFEADKVRSVLDIPEDYTVVAVSPLGYRAEDPAPKPRKSAEEVICYNKFE